MDRQMQHLLRVPPSGLPRASTACFPSVLDIEEPLIPPSRWVTLVGELFRFRGTLSPWKYCADVNSGPRLGREGSLENSARTWIVKPPRKIRARSGGGGGEE